MASIERAATQTERMRRGLLTAGYLVAVLLVATLLFGLEPLFVKMALPLFRRWWNAAFASFSVIMLAGCYTYAHALACLAVRHQLLIHGSLLLVAAWQLPITHGHPSWHLRQSLR